jgi:glycosyltransferase involved in cell wall biosynthesis
MITSQYDIPISGAMIVQDEEKYIERALRNLKPCVAEIIVVDGGSKDRTVQICEDYGCTVLHRKFDFHFSNQRNHAIEHCNKKWVLWLDADEYYDDHFFDILPDIVTNPELEYDAYRVWKKIYMND